MHSAGNAAVTGRCAASDRELRGYYNNIRLNSATGYITPNDMLAGRQAEIHAERDRKLEEARQQRQLRRRQATYADADRLKPMDGIRTLQPDVSLSSLPDKM